MATYLISGVSRGLGFEFLRQASNNPANTVVGLVRNKTATEKKVSEELPDRKNIRLVRGDLDDYVSLKTAIDETADITGGALDYVIANAAYMSTWSAYDPLGVLGKQPEELEQDLLFSFKSNVIGNIHLFNLSLPLIFRGRVKKVIAISSGFADADLTAKFNIHDSAPYSVSKAALNMAVAKFSAEYSTQGILFMTVSPGMVDTGLHKDATPEQQQKIGVLVEKFQAYAPHFTGPTTAEVAVGLMLSVAEKASIEAGDGGSSVSQFGNKEWLKAGVHVGQVTIGKDGDNVLNGVTVILPRHPDDIYIPCYAGMYTLNGNGKASGSYQIADWGYTSAVRPSPHSPLCPQLLDFPGKFPLM
ncbi:hypothetical protein G7Y89_g3767 [Cudoniella acicularis]|uniref:Uncharacterized protein n=1 Tax=Cudoniella acicularis TaxID=354080 RepID=A0A8H4RRK1_9HELO|nr:hypothetical protein G7Y89_g3767 [Cudoniella acicularis]